MKSLGVKNIVLSSVFSADKNEVVDFMKVNGSLGTENSMEVLINKLQSLGIQFIFCKKKKKN